MTKDKHEYPQILPPDRHVQEAMDIKAHYEKQLAGAKELLDQSAKERARLSEQNEVLLKKYHKEVEDLRATNVSLQTSGFEQTVAWDKERKRHKETSAEHEEFKAKFAALQVEFDTLREQYDALQRVNTKLASDKEGVHRLNVSLHEQLMSTIERSIQLEKIKPPTPRMVDPAGWMLDPTVPIPVEERRRIAKNYGFVDAELNHSYKSVYIVLIIALTLVAFGVLEVMQ